MDMYGYVRYSIFTRKPPLSPTRNLLGIQRTLIQWNLKDVSTEFLGNHQIPNPGKLHIQGNFQGI